ncbi:hypothetical protein, variant [Aphanomyces astaci]|uniref:Uncharacterized protein n=1 Tax=Aphanomyces astaci TaxID=112090 RepID=W4H9N8_APHAT|nr:hypothetical protein, variant [Aphanomyces astaci]ETV87838.1 hypothetical protein, variant [Aphanomyces astaci]|eukprot:XP_009822701.1 hypothetical protein, variant [Aphanomyces astaci]
MCFLDSSIIQRIDACRRAMDQANPRALAIPVVYYPVLYERRYKLHFTIEATVLPSRVNVATLMPATSACFGSVSYICKVSYIRYGNQQANPGWSVPVCRSKLVVSPVAAECAASNV